jgi:hypothetical protein
MITVETGPVCVEREHAAGKPPECLNAKRAYRRDHLQLGTFEVALRQATMKNSTHEVAESVRDP